MTPVEVATWVRQFADEIAAEPDPERRLNLLLAWRDAQQVRLSEMMAEAFYRLRRVGWSTEALDAWTGLYRHKVARMAKDWALRHGEPSASRPSVPDISGAVRRLPTSSR